MSSEKEFKRQRKALVDIVKKLIYLSTSNPFTSDVVTITLQQIPNMNSDNIKPILESALGYMPEILLYQNTVVSGEDGKKIPVVLIELKLR